MKNKQNNPKISVITPCLNRVEFIAFAIESVVNQNHPNFEHIIVDGGSTDGTLDVLARYPHLRVISEPDKGMYDALNKGLMHASGDFIGFLNSDDLYAPGALNAITGAVTGNSIDFIVGRSETFSDSNTATIRSFDSGILDHLLEKSILGDSPINAFFFCSNVFNLIGNFDDTYQIVADREFVFRLSLAGLVGLEIPQLLYRYREHPGSMTFDMSKDKFREIVDEQLLWTNKYLRILSISKEARKFLGDLRTQITIRICAHCLRERNFARAYFYMREGFRFNPFWFYRFFKHALLHPIRQKLGLSYRTP